MHSDTLGDRMKSYESTDRFAGILPVIGRVDGITFHSFTNGLERPYDERLSKIMIEVAEWLLTHFGATAAYTQSDEITLGWHQKSFETELFCGGRVQKLCSHLAAKTSVRFNTLLPQYLPEKAGKEAYFDARVFTVPNLTEAANQFLWREQDATKNSISMAARAYFSHKMIDGKNGPEMLSMLLEKKVDWNDYPNFFKRGTFIIPRTISTPFTQEELKELPPLHHARRNPDLIIERRRCIRYANLPKFSTVTNREEFLFLGKDPIFAKE
jgi:tRNA(His) guanylyltransferase